MELSIKVEELRKVKLFVATPMYGGSCNGLYMKACLDLQGLCMSALTSTSQPLPLLI